MLASEKRISSFDGINDGAMLLGELKVDNVIGSLCNTEKRSKQKSSKQKPRNFAHPVNDLCLVSRAMPPLVKHASCIKNQLKFCIEP